MRTVLSLLALATPLLAHSANTAFESTSELQSMAVAYLQAHITPPDGGDVRINADTLDNRLQLPACARADRQYSLPAGYQASNTHAVAIRCIGKTPWSIYVPVQISITKNVLTTSHALTAGQRLAKDDCHTIPVELHQLSSGYFQDVRDLEGKILKRPMGAHAVITHNDVIEPAVIKRGDIVTVTAKTGPIQVTIKGTALADGQAGGTINVRNNSTQRPISGIVTGPGAVSINVT